MIIQNNSILEDINTLNDLDIGIETINIINNPSLSQCAVNNICNSFSLSTASVTINNNNNNNNNNNIECNSILEVETACQLLSLSDYELSQKNSISLYQPTIF